MYARRASVNANKFTGRQTFVFIVQVSCVLSDGWLAHWLTVAAFFCFRRLFSSSSPLSSTSLYWALERIHNNSARIVHSMPAVDRVLSFAGRRVEDVVVPD